MNSWTQHEVIKKWRYYKHLACAITGLGHHQVLQEAYRHYRPKRKKSPASFTATTISISDDSTVNENPIRALPNFKITTYGVLYAHCPLKQM